MPCSLSSTPTQSEPPVPSSSVFSHVPPLFWRAYVPSAVAAMTRTDRSAPTAMSITPVSEITTESVMSSEVQDPGLSQPDEHER